MVSDVRSVALNLNSKELIFLQKVTRQEYHFITDEEQEARLRLRDKLLEGFFDQNENRIVLNLTRDELLFLIKVARENYSFIVRTEKEARLALAAKLHKTAEAVFGVFDAAHLDEGETFGGDLDEIVHAGLSKRDGMGHLTAQGKWRNGGDCVRPLICDQRLNVRMGGGVICWR